MKFKSIFLASILVIFSIVSSVSAIQISEEKKSEIGKVTTIITEILDDQWGFQSVSYDSVMDSLVEYENKFETNWDEMKLAIAWLLKTQILNYYTSKSVSDYAECFNTECKDLEEFRMECEKYWWIYKSSWRGGSAVCNLLIPDANTPCDDTDQCLWYCLAETELCSEIGQYDCVAHLRDWSVRSICD